MLVRLLLALAILLGLYLLVRWLARTPAQSISRQLKRFGLWAAVGVILLLVATGRLNWLFAVLAAAVPVIQRLLALAQLLPALKRLGAMLGLGSAPTAGARGQSSTIQTRFLRMTLDHATGAMNGTVLQGRFQGRTLADLGLEDLLALLTECRLGDEQSAAVLEAYLDRVHGDAWRAPAGGPSPPPTSGGGMSREEAYAILGLEPGASPEAVREAHRRLMQRLHPDRGGSTYLAAKINQAKDLLLGP
jgi:hypothetical protein